MRYRDLNISFKIENSHFTILSLSVEKHLRPIPMHAHSKNSYELHYISFGIGTLNCGSEKYSITPGTLFMTGPEIPHEQISDPENPMTEYCVYLKIDRWEKSRQSSLSDIFADTFFWFGSDDGRVHELIKKTFAELDSSYSGRELMIESLMIQLVLIMIRLYQSGGSRCGKSDEKSLCGDLTYLIIEEAFLYDYSSITLNSLAEKLGLGKRQTERLLQKHYNKTFQQKKIEARMFAASVMLRESRKSITEISEELGYSSCEHFSDSFKKYSGVAPSEYRKRGI